MASTYTVLDTQPTIYQDPVKGIINGVLVRFTIDNYNEVHEVRVTELNVKTVQAAIEKIVKQRDELATLGKSE